MRNAPVSGEPIFHAKTPNTRELTDIGGDRRGTPRMGMGCDQEVIGTNWSAHGLKLCTDAAIFDVSRDVERKDSRPP
ncbi:hypothetical protein ASE69_20495 [Sphingomonas sp. Leaf208]|nr:hypothetical protein ASE69_20495 [Sphingomonas sp. Leaf208]